MVRCRFTSRSTCGTDSAMPAIRRSAGFSICSSIGSSRCRPRLGEVQPHVNRDRADDHFLTYIGALIGIAPSAAHRDTVPDPAKLFHVGTLARQVRDADGLAAIIRQFFACRPIEEFVGHWLIIAPRDRTTCRPKARFSARVRCWVRGCGTIRASSASTSDR